LRVMFEKKMPRTGKTYTGLINCIFSFLKGEDKYLKVIHFAINVSLNNC